MVLKRAVILKIYYMPNGPTSSSIHKKIHQIFRDVGGRWKNYQRKILLKIFKQPSSKLKKSYSQDLVKQTVASSVTCRPTDVGRPWLREAWRHLLLLGLALGYYYYSLSDGGGWSKMKVSFFRIQSVNSQAIVTKFFNHYNLVIWQQPWKFLEIPSSILKQKTIWNVKQFWK